MPSGEKIADAYVQIEADLSNIPNGLNKLQATIAQKILDIQKKTAAQLARNQLEMKVAVQKGDFKAITSLTNAGIQLQATMDRVNQAALNQAAALAAMGGAANRAAVAQQNLGAAAGRAGRSIQQSTMSGAMGLMALSQTIDDAQYGFRAIVNQVPQLGMGLASMFGASSEEAMKFGAVAGIVAVAINVLINHWDDLLDVMGLGRILTEAEAMDKLAKATRRTADEQERLNRFKREQKVIEEMGSKQSSGQEKTEAEVKALLADFGEGNTTGFDRIVGGLAASRAVQGTGEKMTPEERAAVGDAKKGAEPGRIDRFVDPIFGALNRWSGGIVGDMRSRATKQKEINQRLEDENINRAKGDVAGAVLDPLKRKELIAEMRKNPGAFPMGAANKLEALSPVKNAAEIAAEKQDPDVARTNEFNEAIAAKAREARAAEDSRLAGAMAGSVGQKYLQSPTMSDETIRAEVKKSMEKAGMSAKEIGDAMVGTARKLRENLDKAVKDRALDRGIEEGVARQQLLKEARERDDKQANLPKSEVMSTSAYLNKLLVASVSKPDQAAAKALVAQEDTAKATMKFADLAEKWESRGIKVIGKDNPARVAPGR